MNRKLIIGLAVGVLFFGLTGIVHAALTTIGYATYDTVDYKLIWDDDNNGNSVVWLDFSNPSLIYSAQQDWVRGLEPQLSYSFIDGYNVSWEGEWRLPTGLRGAPTSSYDGSTRLGYNVTDSEMGHLFYIELGNSGRYNALGEVQANYGLSNTGEFANLIQANYWAGFVYASNVPYTFSMATGIQDVASVRYNDRRAGLAIHSAQISQTPVPSSLILFATGLFGLIRLNRERLE